MPTFGCRWTMFVLTREWQSLLSGSDSEIVALFYSQMLWPCFFGVNLGYYYIWDDVFIACFVKVSDICRMCVAWIWVVLGSRRMRRVPEHAILHSYVLCWIVELAKNACYLIMCWIVGLEKNARYLVMCWTIRSGLDVTPQVQYLFVGTEPNRLAEQQRVTNRHELILICTLTVVFIPVILGTHTQE